MATLPSPDPDRFSGVHVLRRTPHPDRPASPPPRPSWRVGLAKMLTGVQLAALLYGFFLFALVAGATPFTDHAGSGEIAIPGLPWFLRAFAVLGLWWLAGVAKRTLLKVAKPWRYGGFEIKIVLWFVGAAAIVLFLDAVL